jgi:hypothetical protein
MVPSPATMSVGRPDGSGCEMAVAVDPTEDAIEVDMYA